MMALDLHGLEQMGETVSVIWDFYCNTVKVLMSDFFYFLLCFLLRAFPMGDYDIFSSACVLGLVVCVLFWI